MIRGRQLRQPEAPGQAGAGGLEHYAREQQRQHRIRVAQNIGLALLALGVAILVYAAIGVSIR